MGPSRLRRAGFAGPLLVCMASMAGTVRDRPLLNNEHVQVAFSAASGQLSEFTDIQNGHEFIGPAPHGGLWQIDLVSPSPEEGIVPADARAFHWKRSENREAIELVWEGFESHQAPDMRVVAVVSLTEDEPTSRWHIAVEGMGPVRASAVRFPRIPCITPQEDEVLAVPVWMGERTSRARELLCDGAGTRFEWEYPGILSMQCLALYRQNGPGLYAACDDTAAFAKRFAVAGESGGHIGLELIQRIENGAAGRAHYESPYRAVLGAFEGDWFTAAERYRNWALEQSWAQHSRLRDGATADWVAKTGLWVWNRGRSSGVLGPARALQERAGMPVSVFWHWWHGCPYDVGFPEYLPPREGAGAFRQALREAQDAGSHALVYMNQRLWGMTTQSWADEGAERYAVKGPDGNVRPEVYNTFTRSPCASMCMGTAFWRNRYAGLAAEAVTDLGVDGIYMDQACSSLACYDPAHGHPLGGGTYWMQGFRMLQADIRERCASTRNVVLAGEGCGEAWLPYLDLMLSLQVSMERYARPDIWEPIPFFHAVYHGFAVFYGNYSSLTMPPYDELWPPEHAPAEPLKLLERAFSQQFRLEQARAFVWGQQPTIANFRPAHFEERAEELDYALRLARLRCKSLKYLGDGTMLRPPAVAVPEETIDVSRLSIYAGQRDALKRYRKRCPVVLASAWQASDGNVAVVLANVSGKPQHFTLDLDTDTYPIACPGEVYLHNGAGKRHLGTSQSGAIVLDVDLGPADACIYEFED